MPGQDIDISASVRNLLLDCAGMAAGDRVLVLTEPADEDYYRRCIVAALPQAARDLGFRVETMQIPFSPLPAPPAPSVLHRMAEVDLTVFLARQGDQVRFQGLPGRSRALVCYALDASALASGFGRLPHAGIRSIRDAVDQALEAADRIRISCPAGTRIEGGTGGRTVGGSDTKTIRFPLSVHSPVAAAGFSGVVAQRGFLVGTGSAYYAPYACRLDDTLFIHVDGNRITGFEGDVADVARAERHYAHVAEVCGTEATFVHSWHAGIHPGCGFVGPASASFERWSGSAFGNPRLLHFHTCGQEPPGQISLNILDLTVEVDGVNLWDRGRLHPDRLERGREVLAAHPDIAAAYRDPVTDCGAGPDGRLSFD